MKGALAELVDRGNPQNDLCQVEPLGHGSTGQVVKAYSTSLRCFVAVKKMSIRAQQRPELLLNEVAVMRRCAHRNILRMFGCYLVEDSLWICMELAAGGCLTNFISKKR